VYIALIYLESRDMIEIAILTWANSLLVTPNLLINL
jgi:hypothetical protein